MKKSVKLYYAREGLKLLRREIRRLKKRDLCRQKSKNLDIYVLTEDSYISGMKLHIESIQKYIEAMEKYERRTEEAKQIEKKKNRTQNSNQTGTYGKV
jgi:hypothetical protein